MRKDKTMKRKYGDLIIGLIMVAVVLCALWAFQPHGTGGDMGKAKRTIMLYDCGADLETSAAM
ncbi:MAG: hypothetical protein IKQ56_05645, partial [Lachnospiraceae bacterium]|nr:hypothetical protein [Lachnospiraceae bacterium]